MASALEHSHHHTMFRGANVWSHRKAVVALKCKVSVSRLEHVVLILPDNAKVH